MIRITFCLLCLLLSSQAYSQILRANVGITTSYLDWRIGEMHTNNYDETFVGYYSAFSLDYMQKRNFSLSNGIVFLRKGGTTKMDLIFPNGETSSSIDKAYLDYISLNWSGVIKFPIKESYILYLSTGPRIDYLLNFSETLQSTQDSVGINKYSYGMFIAGGLRYEFNNVQIGIQLNQYINFSNISEWPKSANNYGGSFKDITSLINLFDHPLIYQLLFDKAIVSLSNSLSPKYLLFSL